jgi:anaerobic magnesium-protoporphyrin IX monomethyl ester cyclase
MATGQKKLDLLLVNAPGKTRIYQSLATDLAAYEPPIWASLIARHIDRRGFSVSILDAEALQMTYAQTVREIIDRQARLTVFAVYGQQPSASTQCMPAAGDVCRMLKEDCPELATLFLGTHMAALPLLTMQTEMADFVCAGEGPTTISALLREISSPCPQFSKIPGLWYREGKTIQGNSNGPNILDLDAELPGMAWDMLPMSNYRAHNWHCWDGSTSRQPYASLYTSLGCPYKCSFCCINAPFGGSGIRYFSPDLVLSEIDILVTKYGIRNIKIADEMFVLNPKHVLGIADRIIERGYDLNVWAYARVDTVRDRFLERLKLAGFNWLALGVESGSKFVRDGVEKGRFGENEIRDVISRIQDHGINVCANYIFGLPDDTRETMQETLDLALSLQTEYSNFYSAMAYPGSPLHQSATARGLRLPESPGGPGWIGYSQHAYETFNLQTDYLSAADVLSFRDKAFTTYFTDPSYLQMMSHKFGTEAVSHINHMTSIKLDRKFVLDVVPDASIGARTFVHHSSNRLSEG